MRIKEFAEKYDVTIRDVDYWTSLHLLHCTTDEKNSYRNYGSEAEDEVKKIIILKAMGLTLSVSNIHKLEDLTDTFWYFTVIDQIQKEEKIATKMYRMAKEFARQIRETSEIK